MPGLDPGIHSAALQYIHRRHGMDCRIKSGNDDRAGALSLRRVAAELARRGLGSALVAFEQKRQRIDDLIEKDEGPLASVE